MKPHDGDPAVVGALAFDLADLDPIGTASAGPQAVLKHVHEPLMRLDSASGRLEPGLLARPPRRLDEDEYELLLRPELSFHDGSAVMAADVVASLEAQQQSNHAKGRVFAGHLAFIREAVATGARSLTVRTNGPAAYLAERLALIRVLPAGRRRGHVGTGPYRIAEADDQRVRLHRDPHYTGPRPALSPAIEFHVVVDGDERVAGLRCGAYDAVEDPPVGSLAELRDDPRFEVAVVPGQNMAWLMFNCGRAPFDDVRVRRAIDHAVDRAALASGVLAGTMKPSATLLPAGHPDRDPGLDEPRFDPDRARALLAEAGYDRMDLDLFVSNATWVHAQLPVVSAQLAAVGISVRPRVGATSEFFATDAVAGRYDLALCSGDPSALGADGAFVLGWYLTGAWQREYLHWTGTEARAIGKLLSEAALTEEPKARRALLARVQRDAAAHGPLVVLGHRAQPTAWAADLFGIRPSGSTGLDLVGVAGRSLLGR